MLTETRRQPNGVEAAHHSHVRNEPEQSLLARTAFSEICEHWRRGESISGDWAVVEMASQASDAAHNPGVLRLRSAGASLRSA